MRLTFLTVSLSLALVAAWPLHAQRDGMVLSPPTAMKIDGVPMISQALAQEIAPYGDFAATRFVGWHPVEQDMLILDRKSVV